MKRSAASLKSESTKSKLAVLCEQVQNQGMIDMQIDLPDEAIKLLQEILPILTDASEIHGDLHVDEEIIAPWTPSDWDHQINCPDLTVGVLHKAKKLQELLRM